MTKWQAPTGAPQTSLLGPSLTPTLVVLSGLCSGLNPWAVWPPQRPCLNPSSPDWTWVRDTAQDRPGRQFPRRWDVTKKESILFQAWESDSFGATAVTGKQRSITAKELEGSGGLEKEHRRGKVPSRLLGSFPPWRLSFRGVWLLSGPWFQEVWPGSWN